MKNKKGYLDQFTKEELCDIWDNLSNKKWDQRLGEKPEKNQEETKKILKEILKRVGAKEMLYYRFVVKDKTITKEFFENWWERR